ncbi:hypothetical protein BDV40DRAFT_256834 [Aspergillus tamarii]|uniref:Uncharacterized protein n=1 Tax=Aspergillus tamarii TaxID=41984 RepID=A0A5N6V563_ASPTM|nr:hypothetical protein BDV40DRAFT_256834 [Aspergillus tamarii]
MLLFFKRRGKRKIDFCFGMEIEAFQANEGHDVWSLLAGGELINGLIGGGGVIWPFYLTRGAPRRDSRDLRV